LGGIFIYDYQIQIVEICLVLIYLLTLLRLYVACNKILNMHSRQFWMLSLIRIKIPIWFSGWVLGVIRFTYASSKSLWETFSRFITLIVCVSFCVSSSLRFALVASSFLFAMTAGYDFWDSSLKFLKIIPRFLFPTLSSL
jgi:hypothetical protein